MLRAKHGNTKKLWFLWFLWAAFLGLGYVVAVQIAPVVITEKIQQQEQKVRGLVIEEIEQIEATE